MLGRQVGRQSVPVNSMMPLLWSPSLLSLRLVLSCLSSSCLRVSLSLRPLSVCSLSRVSCCLVASFFFPPFRRLPLAGDTLLFSSSLSIACIYCCLIPLIAGWTSFTCQYITAVRGRAALDHYLHIWCVLLSRISNLSQVPLLYIYIYIIIYVYIY